VVEFIETIISVSLFRIPPFDKVSGNTCGRFDRLNAHLNPLAGDRLNDRVLSAGLFGG